MLVAYSIGGMPIRLTEERWTHSVDNHDESWTAKLTSCVFWQSPNG